MVLTNQVEEGPVKTADKDAINHCADIDLSGRVLADYTLLRRIGRGGTGQVYLAKQHSLGREVAVKLLQLPSTDSRARRTALARFKAEADALARATHPNIIQVYGIGKAAGLHYMALEYIAGGNLGDYVEKNYPVPAAAGLRIMSQVAAALHRACELNIIHRDIKPENILIGPAGEIKVADFGLMRCFNAATTLTASGLVMGTPLYMSPEQVDARQALDCRSDIYSFGATCYFMFAGQPPFGGKTPLEVAYKQVHNQPEPLCEIRPDLPVELCAVIERMMAKSPTARYQTTRELINALDGVTARMPSVPSAKAAGEATASAEPQAGPAERPSAGVARRYYLLGSLCLVALMGGVVVRQQMEPPWPRVTVARGANPNSNIRSAAHYENEVELLTRRQTHYTAKGALDLKVLSGLSAAVDLGLLYLNERRLDEAESLFRELCPGGVEQCHGRLLNEVGGAMVLAFRGEAAESNSQFLAFASDIDRLAKLQVAANSGAALSPAVRDELAIYGLLWQNENPAVALREMVAKALYHNFQNDPTHFPAALEPFRHPPYPSDPTRN